MSAIMLHFHAHPDSNELHSLPEARDHAGTAFGVAKESIASTSVSGSPNLAAQQTICCTAGYFQDLIPDDDSSTNRLAPQLLVDATDNAVAGTRSKSTNEQRLNRAPKSCFSIRPREDGFHVPKNK